MVQSILHSTLCIFILCLLLFAVFVMFKLPGYLSFLHLNLAHKLRLYIFSAVYISLHKKYFWKVSSEAESKSQT